MLYEYSLNCRSRFSQSIFLLQNTIVFALWWVISLMIGMANFCGPISLILGFRFVYHSFIQSGSCFIVCVGGVVYLS